MNIRELCFAEVKDTFLWNYLLGARREKGLILYTVRVKMPYSLQTPGEYGINARNSFRFVPKTHEAAV